MMALRAFWAWLRAVSGDDAYERYLAHHAAAHPDRAPLDRRAFFPAAAGSSLESGEAVLLARSRRRVAAGCGRLRSLAQRPRQRR
jgi:Protein of unknown function (DUF466).